jgi:hypothetical protein
LICAATGSPPQTRPTRARIHRRARLGGQSSWTTWSGRSRKYAKISGIRCRYSLWASMVCTHNQSMSISQFYLKLTPRRSQGGGIVLGQMCDLDPTNHPSLKYVNGVISCSPTFGLAKPLPGPVYWILKQITRMRPWMLFPIQNKPEVCPPCDCEIDCTISLLNRSCRATLSPDKHTSRTR